MRTMIQQGNTVTFVNDTEAVILGDNLLFFGTESPMVGVASSTVQPGGEGSARVEGVFLLPAAAGGAAILQGAPVYGDPATGLVTGTAAASAVYVGRAWEAAAAGARHLAVRINFAPPVPAGADASDLPPGS